ncbi:MAG: hypothetical protein ABL927_10130 [Bdellovibrionales bacterium]
MNSLYQIEQLEPFSKIALDIANLLSIAPPPQNLLKNETALPAPILNSLVKYRNYLVHAIVEKEINPKNDILMFKSFLDFYSLTVPFDIEKHVSPGDIIEVYGEDFVQIYRNRTFFDFCSYDIYTLLSNPFQTLFRRDEDITAKITEKAMQCLTKGAGIEAVGVEPHLMQEHFARNDKVFEIENKWCSPVYSRVTGSVLGLFCTMKAKNKGRSNVHGIGFISH